MSGMDIDEQAFEARVDELISRGLERYGDGELEAALAEWKHAQALDPDSVRVDEYITLVERYFELNGGPTTIKSDGKGERYPFGVSHLELAKLSEDELDKVESKYDSGSFIARQPDSECFEIDDGWNVEGSEASSSSEEPKEPTSSQEAELYEEVELVNEGLDAVASSLSNSASSTSETPKEGEHPESPLPIGFKESEERILEGQDSGKETPEEEKKSNTPVDLDITKETLLPEKSYFMGSTVALLKEQEVFDPEKTSEGEALDDECIPVPQKKEPDSRLSPESLGTIELELDEEDDDDTPATATRHPSEGLNSLAKESAVSSTGKIKSELDIALASAGFNIQLASRDAEEGEERTRERGYVEQNLEDDISSNEEGDEGSSDTALTSQPSAYESLSFDEELTQHHISSGSFLVPSKDTAPIVDPGLSLVKVKIDESLLSMDEELTLHHVTDSLPSQSAPLVDPELSEEKVESSASEEDAESAQGVVVNGAESETPLEKMEEEGDGDSSFEEETRKLDLSSLALEERQLEEETRELDLNTLEFPMERESAYETSPSIKLNSLGSESSEQEEYSLEFIEDSVDEEVDTFSGLGGEAGGMDLEHTEGGISSSQVEEKLGDNSESLPTLHSIVESAPSGTLDERAVYIATNLIDAAKEMASNAHSTLASDMIIHAMEHAEDSDVALQRIAKQERKMVQILVNGLGELSDIPQLLVGMSEIPMDEMNHRSAFLMTRMDGTLTLEEILDVSGMPRLEALRHLTRLQRLGYLGVN